MIAIKMSGLWNICTTFKKNLETNWVQLPSRASNNLDWTLMNFTVMQVLDRIHAPILTSMSTHRNQYEKLSLVDINTSFPTKFDLQAHFTWKWFTTQYVKKLNDDDESITRIINFVIKLGAMDEIRIGKLYLARSWI